MGAILLTVLTVLLGFGLGKGVPQLVQRSGTLARRSRGTQLAYGTLLLLPWLVGIALVVFTAHGRDKPIPFGPYLAAAGFIALFWGDVIARKYLPILS